jgi:hypothetical protein
MVPFVSQQHHQQQAAAAVAAAAAPVPHPGLAMLLYNGAGTVLPEGAPGDAQWAAWPALGPHDDVAAGPALANGAARPDEVMLGFGWGSGIWGRP